MLLPVIGYARRHLLVSGRDNGGPLGPQQLVRLIKNRGGREKLDHLEIDVLHLGHRMLLIVFDIVIAQLVLVHHVLQAEKGGGLVTADLAQVIGASATKGYQLGVGIFLDINLVKGAIGIVLYPENSASCKIIVLHEFNKSYRMDLLASADNLIGSVIVNILEYVG